MLQGVFVDNTPLIKIVVGFGKSIQTPIVVLDTGFTGDLQVTRQMANELGLRIIGATRTQIANGQIVDIPVAQALSVMEGVQKSIQVLISGNMPLAGISFLSKFSYQAVVDCKNKTVTLERV